MSLGVYNTERRRISGGGGWCYCLKVEVVGDLVGDVLSDRLTAIVDEPIDHVPRNILPHTDSVRKRTISHIQNGLLSFSDCKVPFSIITIQCVGVIFSS